MIEFNAEIKNIRALATANRGLDLVLHIPEDWSDDVQKALKAWLLFKNMDKDGNIPKLKVNLEQVFEEREAINAQES